jgi:hypothetical protein
MQCPFYVLFWWIVQICIKVIPIWTWESLSDSAIDGRASLAISFNTRSQGVPSTSRSSNEVSSTDVHQRATSVHDCCILTSNARLTKGSWFQSPSQATQSARKASSPSHTAPFSSSTTVCLATFIRHLTAWFIVAWPARIYWREFFISPQLRCTAYQPVATWTTSLRWVTVSSYHAFILCAYSHYHCAHIVTILWMKPHARARARACVCV